MTRSTRTAVVQLCATPSVDDPIATAERLTRAARADGAEIVLLPEAFAFLGPESAKVRILEPLPDTADATHYPMFHQIEGLVIDRGITFADLAGTIESFTKAFFGPGFTSRLRPSYFPFTEPSAEFDIRRHDGTWIELGGCGMVHPHVLRAGGLDPNEWSGFAFGFGIDRMAKERHGINDIRDMYSDDVRFTEQFS